MRDMRESGVEWLGEIPSGWTITRIKNLFELRNERNYEALEDVNLISLYTDKGVVQHSDLEKTTGNKAVTADGYKIVKKDDIVVNIILCWMGAVGRSDYDGVTSPAYDIYKPNEGTNSRYYHYLFRTSQFNGECYRYGRGIMLMRWRTYSTEFRAISIPQPPADEQERIVRFLDAKMIQVDALIANVQAQIEKLKAYKQSVITEAVTKGLDPTVPIKDSGVEWVPQIPLSWEISRVGLHYTIILGKMLCPSQIDDSYTLEKYYCAANVHFGEISSDELKEMWFSPVEKEQYRISVGDMLIVEGGAGAGGCAIVQQHTNALIQNSVMIVRNRRGTDNRYLRYWIEFMVKRGYLDVACNKATIPHYTKEKLAKTIIPALSQEEQKQIADYLDEKCDQIDRLIAIKQAKIEKLEQYKCSLIYEYVTGKKEVC